MKRNLPIRLAAVIVAGCVPVFAQSNAVPGLDAALEDTWNLDMFTRGGTYPNGVGAMGAWTTICNPGTSAIQFQAAMDPHHAFIHYLVVRESNGRFEEISNRGYVKHTFGSSNDPSSCGTCAGTGRFSWVEIGCSDTYAASQACDHFNLGPPEEVDPWLGTWVSTCSLFDRGDPPVAPSSQCNNQRSLTQTQANLLNGTIHNQMLVRDQDLLTPGATYWYQSAYNVPLEPDANRGNNMGSRSVSFTWNGTTWVTADTSTYLQGTILQRWSGSSLSSGGNGNDDGRFYVAVKVTGPTNGRYHYEYAVQNRDNKRGMGALRIPVCPSATVSGFGFHDIDQDLLNNWTGSKVGGEIVFTTGSSANPQRWNSIFNFWFDCDAAPITGSSLSLDQYDLGPGAATVFVTSTAPGGLYNENLGPGCGIPNAPTLFAAGTPAQATLPNASFELRTSNALPFSIVVFALSTVPGTSLVAPGCTVYSGDVGTVQLLGYEATDVSGLAIHSQPVPNNPVFEGMTFDLQAANLVTTGSWLGSINLSNGLRVRAGNLLTGCP